MSNRTPRRWSSLALLVLCAACGGRQDAHEALDAFDRFQAALRTGEAACRELVTEESRPALTDLPWPDIRDKRPLVVLGADGAGAEFVVRVQDPNEHGRAAEFVVVREYGRFVVDLVASAGRAAEVVEATATRDEFAPRELTPADHDRIRRHELAQPPR